MADIVLYTQDDQITYEGVETIEVPTADGGTAVFSEGGGGTTGLVDYVNNRATIVAEFGCCNMTGVKTFTFQKVTTFEAYAVYECYDAVKIDLHAATSIGSFAFYGAHNAEALIIRTATMCELTSGNAAWLLGYKSLIYQGLGFIYVPSALVETYKADAVWGKVYPNSFRAIEDYPDICGT